MCETFRCRSKRDAADAEQHFLADPIVLIAAVQRIGKRAVVIGVLRQVGIQQIDGHDESGQAVNAVAPGANVDVAILDANRKRHFDRGKNGFRLPRIGLLDLVPSLIEALAEIALSVRQRDRHHGQFQVGCRAQHVPARMPKPPPYEGIDGSRAISMQK